MQALKELFYAVIDRLGAKTGVAVATIISIAQMEVPDQMAGQSLYLWVGKLVALVIIAVGFFIYRRQQESEQAGVKPLEGGDSK